MAIINNSMHLRSY